MSIADKFLKQIIDENGSFLNLRFFTYIIFINLLSKRIRVCGNGISVFHLVVQVVQFLQETIQGISNLKWMFRIYQILSSLVVGKKQAARFSVFIFHVDSIWAL